MKTYSGLEEVLDQILTIRVENDFSVKVLYPLCAKAIMTIIHGLQAYATHTICSNLKVFQLQYKFKLTVRTNRLNKICAANLHWYAKYSECIAKYIWAWKFFISHRQWSWNRLKWRCKYLRICSCLACVYRVRMHSGSLESTKSLKVWKVR